MTHTETIVYKTNARIRQLEGKRPWSQIMAAMSDIAEQFATELYGCTMEDIEPELAGLLLDIKEAGGAMTGKQFCRSQDFNLVTLEDPENAFFAGDIK